jgi:hypothetical protein
MWTWLKRIKHPPEDPEIPGSIIISTAQKLQEDPCEKLQEDPCEVCLDRWFLDNQHVTEDR